MFIHSSGGAKEVLKFVLELFWTSHKNKKILQEKKKSHQIRFKLTILC